MCNITVEKNSKGHCKIEVSEWKEHGNPLLRRPEL